MVAIRNVIIIAAVAASLLWIYYGRVSHRWQWPILCLIWLIPVAGFFTIRQVLAVPPLTLNYVSISLYLIGIGICGGVAVAKIRELRLGRDE